MQTEYQLRLKDLHLQERVKELTEKFTAELENDRQKFELLLQVRIGRSFAAAGLCNKPSRTLQHAAIDEQLRSMPS